MQTSMNSAITRCLRFGLRRNVSWHVGMGSVQTCEDLLGRSLDELLAAADVAFVDHDMGQLRLIEVDNATTVVLDELLNFHKPGNERQY